MTQNVLPVPEAGDATHYAAIGDLVSNTHAVDPETPVREVADEFFANARLDAVALVRDSRPTGLVTRGKFLFTVFRQFGWEIYQRKPVLTLSQPNPLMLPDWSRLDAALRLALQRDSQDIYDEVIVVRDDGHFAGLLPVRQMVIQQTHALANVIVQKELAHERAKELEEIGRIKSQFLANVTHELRSPVNAIIELAELMRIAADKGHAGQVRDRLTLMLSSATNLRSVITNMLDLSKIEAGRMKLFVERFDLAELLQEVGATTRVLLGPRPVEVVVSVECSPFEMSSDPVKLRQIVLNLASNAAKFTEQGRIAIQQTSRAGRVTISVSDTGIGMRSGDLEKLFIAFSQIDDAHTKSREGSGLGLAITRELVQMLGGSVSVESDYGRGSRFTIDVPQEAEE